jgi:N-methylhydantoinase A
VVEVSDRVGADVGGTFTDVVLQRGDGSVSLRKLLSTPPGYERAVVEAIGALAAPPRGGHAIAAVIHGTTVATNAVLERRGSRTALVTTRGFRDVLELRRLRIPDMYDLFWRKPPALVDRELRFEIGERVLADGQVERPIDEAEVRTLAARLRTEAVDAVAVCLLNSYLYPEHEHSVAAILRSELDGVAVSTSAEILREQGEYERTATTAVNAYIQPLMSSYLDRIRSGLDDRGINAPLMIMQSSGGIMTSDEARVRPVFALESGPAAGVVAAQAIARRLGRAQAISFDMGGTTAKASLIEHGDILRAREYEAGGTLSVGSRLLRGGGELLRIPTIDIAEVGAGGGSIAWIDAAGGFHVGPRSAGAEPGPACYGRGGETATVTDANVVLGFTPSGRIADGEISISGELAEEAVRRIANPLGLSLIDAAKGVHRLANAQMMRALRAVSSERGRDPREFALIAYGGAGPVHAAGLAAQLDIRTVLIPPLAGFFSAVGLLFARHEFHDVRTCQVDPRAAAPEELERLFEAMRSAIERQLPRENEYIWVRSTDVRYRGQSWEIEVSLPSGSIRDSSLEELIERFEAEHELLYGFRHEPGSSVEVRAARLAAIGPPPQHDVALGAPITAAPPEATRQAHFDAGESETPVVNRAAVGPDPSAGPVLIDEYDTTVVVPPDWQVHLDSTTNVLILERGSNGG